MKSAASARVAWFVLGAGLLVIAAAAQASTVWMGPRVTFAKASNVDESEAANQDRLTPQVWLTRAPTQGLFNARTEKSYSDISPADTEWAYGTTADLSGLKFAPWVDWHQKCPLCSVGQDAVLHLMSEDIYVDVRFTAWGGSGGSFAYERSTPSGSSPASSAVVEYYNADLDHYFITWVADEIAKLDAGTVIKGWVRTGRSFRTYTAPQAGASPVCRYYIPPALGDSHFFGRGTVECDTTGQRNPSFVLEDPNFMQLFLPTLGVCPADTTPVYRVFSNRPDANHRYMTDKSDRDRMVALGWVAEGDGPDLVVMCAPP